MQTIGYKLTPFRVTGVKPGYTKPTNDAGESAFMPITEKTLEGKWKVLYFYPKNFTFVCPTEIMSYDQLRDQFADRNALLLGGCTDNEFTLLAWRQSHVGLGSTAHWGFADTRPQYVDNADEDGEYRGNLIDQLGVRHGNEGVALRATFIIDPQGVSACDKRGMMVGTATATYKLYDQIALSIIGASRRPLLRTFSTDHVEREHDRHAGAEQRGEVAREPRERDLLRQLTEDG